MCCFKPSPSCQGCCYGDIQWNLYLFIYFVGLKSECVESQILDVMHGQNIACHCSTLGADGVQEPVYRVCTDYFSDFFYLWASCWFIVILGTFCFIVLFRTLRCDTGSQMQLLRLQFSVCVYLPRDGKQQTWYNVSLPLGSLFLYMVDI